MHYLRYLRVFSLTALCALSAVAQFKVAGKDVQVHAFFQQGFLASTGNNFLTMQTKGGSFAMTDGGFNIGAKLTPKLRVGAQAFSRNIGDLGNGNVRLDWAFADYKFNDYIGIRGGQVKTTIGLFNDTQDMEFIHTFALLPQSLYPTDLRASTISHQGGDLYGDINLRKAGRLSYVLYGGMLPEDRQGGYFFGLAPNSPLNYFSSWIKGSDVRWATPLSGLTVGYSAFITGGVGTAKLKAFNGRPVPGGLAFRFDVDKSNDHTLYADYQRGKFRTFAEWRKTDAITRITGFPSPLSNKNSTAWYAAASYRVHSKVELGGYYSSYIYNRNLSYTPDNSMRGPVLSARFDLTRYWNFKVEEHFIDGYGNRLGFRSFYPQVNARGFKDNTNVFIIRTGVTF